MTLEQINARMSAHIDEACRNAVELLVDRGATVDEVDEMLRWYVPMLTQECANALTEIRRWMDEPDAPSFKLQ